MRYMGMPLRPPKGSVKGFIAGETGRGKVAAGDGREELSTAEDEERWMEEKEKKQS